ncbi:RNA methyltransferase [Mycobacterium tuberculosis]|nr:RNA methyltransferase [Mycobacterium tuberculosis]
MSALGPGPTEWGAPTGGVGPWAGDLPDDPRYDPVLLRDGDARNVVDAYRYWTREAIIADIDTRRHPLHVAIENFGHDANIGSWCAPPMHSPCTPCTSSGVGGGIGAAPW